MIKRLVLILCLMFISAGCAQVLNPYHENFDCQARGEGGKCVDTDRIYKILSNTPSRTSAKKSFDDNLSDAVIMPRTASASPLLKQAEVIRVLVLPYIDKEELYMSRYIYMVDKEPRWNIGK